MTFIATVGQHKYYFWFKEAANEPGEPEKPPEKEDLVDEDLAGHVDQWNTLSVEIW